ncbi:MAG: radical SAM family heme chaperone HemW [Candidatus Melainabacteria bacterium]|nr:radical SAM family heme chaperone HemW [Candidatus Melainabacteria bacterium]
MNIGEKALKARSVYIHLPFCKSICPYCDFASYANKSAEMKATYLAALKTEIRAVGELLGNIFCNGGAESASKFTIDTVFFGGGTPSIHSAKEIEEILNALKEYVIFSDDAEITLEANPGTVDLEKLQAFKDIGINRLSIGAQTFNQDILSKLARGHTVEETFEIIDLIKKVNFKSWSFDLIYGLPHQSLDDWKSTLELALEKGSPHLSAYALSIEPITPFGSIYGSSEHPDLAGEEALAEMYEVCNQMLKERGLNRYEVSNWAKGGHESRHNLCYWKADEYLAFGLSAHGYLRGYRFAHTRDIEEYIRLFTQPVDIIQKALRTGTIYEDYKFIGKKEALEEEIMLGLRLSSGLEKRNEILSLLNREKINTLISEGFILEYPDRFSLSEKGYFLSNGVISYILAG